MNRKIKFRGYDEENKCWRYGYYYHGINVELNPRISHFIIDEGEMWYIHDPESIGQYAGIKDKNGVEIYEGDILNTLACYDREELAIVSFNDENYGGVMGWNLLNIRGEAFEYYYGQSPNEEHEIVGNIYENPELLEDQDDD